MVFNDLLVYVGTEERILRTNTPDEVPLFFPCAVHQASTSQTWQLSVVNTDISAVVACALFMSGAGSVETFRRHLLATMKEMLVLVHSEPPGGRVQAHRQAIYNLYLGSDNLSRAEGTQAIQQRREHQRLVLDMFLAGDYEDTSRVCLYSRGKALTFEDAEHILTEFIVPALIPTSLAIFPRHRWLGGELAIDQLGLIQATHGLLAKVLLRMTAHVAQMPAVAELEEITEAWDGTVDAALVSAASKQAAEGSHATGEPNEEALPATQQDAVRDWAALKKSCQQKVRHWARVRDLNVLVVIRTAMSIVTGLLHSLLKKADPAWERLQHHAASQGLPRKYRVSVFALGTDLDRAFDRVATIMHSPIQALPARSWRMGFKVLLLRMLARVAAALEFFLGSASGKAPYLVFRLLDSDPVSRQNTARQLLDPDSPQCVHDAFTRHFVTKFPTADKMLSTEARMFLHAVAVLSDIDVSGIECRHASIRSLLDQRSRTWSPRISLVSADFLLRQAAKDLMHRHGASSKLRRRVWRQRPACKKKRGGGGAQRSFFSTKLRGTAVWKLTQQDRRRLFRRLNAEFRGLRDEEKQQHLEVGAAATISHRAGGVSFAGWASDRRWDI